MKKVGIIWRSGSFRGQFGDQFGVEIISGAVQAPTAALHGILRLRSLFSAEPLRRREDHGYMLKQNNIVSLSEKLNLGKTAHVQKLGEQGWRSGRALAFHQCGSGSIPGPGVKSGLSLLVLYSASRGFSPGTPVFPSPQKPTFEKGIPSIGITSGISCTWY